MSAYAAPYILHLDCGGGYTGAYIFQISLNYIHFKQAQFITYK